MNTCCYNCKKRKVGCHSTCPDYIKAKQEHDAEKQKIKENAAKDTIYVSHAIASHYRIEKHIRRHSQH